MYVQHTISQEIVHLLVASKFLIHNIRKRHIYIEEGLEELIKENLPLLDLLER